jgi:hypothetical protein
MTLDEFNKLPEAPGLKACRILPSEVTMINGEMTIAVDALWKLAAIAPDPEGAADYLEGAIAAVKDYFASSPRGAGPRRIP